MKKFTLTLAALAMTTASAFALETPTNGVYQVYNYDENNSISRGYMVQNLDNNTLHVTGARLSSHSGSTFNVDLSNGNWNTDWYLYTSTTTNNSYIFSINNGLFLAQESGVLFNLSETPTPLTIETSTKNSSYYQIKTKDATQYFGNSIDWEKNDASHRTNLIYRLNSADDDAVPHSFKAVSGEYDQDVIDAAIEKINNYELAANSQISQTYNSSAAFWTASAVYPAGLNNSTSFTKDNTTDTASDHFGNDEHTLYKAVTPVNTFGYNNVVTFTYSGGSHGLIILGVDMVNESGKVVASDYHIGFTGGVHVKNTYTLSGAPAGEYMLRYYVCNKANNHELRNTNGTITVSATSTIEDAEVAKSMFDALVEVTDSEYTSAVGYYASTEAIETAKNATATEETPAAYAKLFAALDDAMENPVVVMPEAGKFYRFKNAFSGKYMTGVVNTQGYLALIDDAEGNDMESVFYYDGTYLVALQDGMVLGNFNTSKKPAAWKTLLKTSEDAGEITFPLSEIAHTFYIQTQLSRRLYGAADTTIGEAVDCAGLATDIKYSWTITEVTELPVYTGGQSLFAVYSPVALYVTDDLIVYTGAISGSTVVTTKESIGEISANTAVLVKNPNEELDEYPDYVYFELNYDAETVAAVAPVNETVAVSGSIYATVATEGTTYYTLQNNTTDAEATVTYLDFMPKTDIIPGFTAHIADSSESAPEYYEVTGEGKTTEIEEIAVESEKAQGIYDLQGRRLSAPVKGINIINGKKVLVK